MRNKKLKHKQPALTGFQLRVLAETAKIPFAQTRTYGWIAKKIGSPKAARAVGVALKNNPWPLVVPCHRVVKSSGNAGDYSLGEPVKKELIAFEKTLKNIFCLKQRKAV